MNNNSSFGVPYTVASFSNQKLSEIPPETLNSLITDLTVDNTTITQISNIPRTLRSLTCKNNRIYSFAPVISQAPKLIKIDLSGNRITNIDGIAKLLDLDTLLLAENNLRNCDFSELLKLRDLRVLDLSFNGLRLSEKTEIIQNLPEIERLYLNKNEFEKFRIMSNMRKIKELRIDSNSKLEVIEIAENIESLEILSANSNKITNINEICKLKNLRELQLNDNKIKEISEIIKNCVKLRILYLANNLLTKIPNLHMPLLEKIDLKSNRLSNLNFLNECKNLVELNISSNILTEIDMIDNLKNLHKLDISRNKLTTAKNIRKLKSLYELDISYNFLENHNELINELSYLKEFSKINSKGNPFTKQCEFYRTALISATPETIKEIDEIPVTTEERVKALEYIYKKPMNSESAITQKNEEQKFIDENTKSVHNLINETRREISKYEFKDETYRSFDALDNLKQTEASPLKFEDRSIFKTVEKLPESDLVQELEDAFTKLKKSTSKFNQTQDFHIKIKSPDKNQENLTKYEIIKTSRIDSNFQNSPQILKPSSSPNKQNIFSNPVKNCTVPENQLLKELQDKWKSAEKPTNLVKTKLQKIINLMNTENKNDQIVNKSVDNLIKKSIQNPDIREIITQIFNKFSQNTNKMPEKKLSAFIHELKNNISSNFQLNKSFTDIIIDITKSSVLQGEINLENTLKNCGIYDMPLIAENRKKLKKCNTARSKSSHNKISLTTKFIKLTPKNEEKFCLDNIKRYVLGKYLAKNTSWTTMSEHQVISDLFVKNGYSCDKVVGIKDRAKFVKETFPALNSNNITKLKVCYYTGSDKNYKFLLKKDKNIPFYELSFAGSWQATQPKETGGMAFIVILDLKTLGIIKRDSWETKKKEEIFGKCDTVYFEKDDVYVVKNISQVCPLYIIEYHH